MNDLESKNQPGGESESCHRHCALQKQVTTLLLGLVILSVTFCVFLWRQSGYLRIDLEAAKGQAMPGLTVFKQQEKPTMDAFVMKLAEFGRTHPDYLRVLATYNIQLPTLPAGAPASAPKTAPAAAPKSAPAVPAKK